jgi:hypothetical protein
MNNMNYSNGMNDMYKMNNNNNLMANNINGIQQF